MLLIGENAATAFEREVVKLFWKRFGQAQSANKLFNQASEHWRQRQRFILEGDEEGVRETCAEVVRLCQLAIQSDERMGDAYVLLANALLSASHHGSGPSDRERYEFLLSREAAVIHLWYSLPHRGYPITKNRTIGERLWRMTVDQLMQDKTLAENDVVVLMELWRNNFASYTISPDSFEHIQEQIRGE